MSDNSSSIKILVVEDESIIAIDIQNMLESLGYTIPAVIFSGEEAIKKSAEMQPDLVLMDIKLNGNIDGVEAAKQIRTRFNIPVVYLTAYSEDNIFHRTEIAEPFGYLPKPFEERGLQSIIEMAFYKNKEEQKIKDG